MGFGVFLITQIIHVAVLPFLDIVLMSTTTTSALVFGLIVGVLINGEIL